jgi:hypothetical protein
MKKPFYDWNWFTSKKPFLKILQKYCDLSIKKEVNYRYELGRFKIPMNKYYISYDMNMLKNNFRDLKQDLLKTNICKNNNEVKEIVECVSIDNKQNFEIDIILNGCITNCEGSLIWDIKNK